MADFKTPNLCGANESLNTALSKIDDIKAEIESKLDSAASEAAAAFETAQADIKAGLDALAVVDGEIRLHGVHLACAGSKSDGRGGQLDSILMLYVCKPALRCTSH